MKARCLNPNNSGFHNYGGRGITVCKRWYKFENFYADMGPRPAGRWTIERIKNSKGYSPTNCRWATYTEQLNNRRNNHRITAFGKTQTLTQWAREFSMRVGRLRGRIVDMGMLPEEALLQKKSLRGKRKA